VLLLCAGIAAAALPAAAAEDDDPAVIAAHWFDRSALDKNGFVSRDELLSGRNKQFRRMDGDGDGALTLDEYLYGIPSDQQGEIALMAGQFSKIDADGDGLVTNDEYIAYADTLLAAGDSDGDGQLDLEEFSSQMLDR
jgi:hypothetical protein